MPDEAPVVSLRNVEKDYRSLRPLRIRQLAVEPAESVVLIGLDKAAAEVLVNLITAATIPDAGDIEAFGIPTHSITDADAWLQAMDRFGILSDRVVLLDALTVEQNLVLPYSLDIDPVTDELRTRVERLAEECGISRTTLKESASALQPAWRLRVRLAKAIALEPKILLAEHPTAALDSAEVSEFASDLRRIAARRRMAMLLVTADPIFGAAAGDRVLCLQPATGELRAAPVLARTPSIPPSWNRTWIRLREAIRGWLRR
jgi:putative ABC transport system ATP-binding protein